MDERNIITPFMLKLIAKCGGFDAAAAILEARWGDPISKGTLSKKKAGQLAWSITDMLALMEATGDWSLLNWMNSLNAEPDALPCHITGAAHLAREHGEAISAVLTAHTPAERAKAIKELHDVRDHADRLIDTMEAQT